MTLLAGAPAHLLHLNAHLLRLNVLQAGGAILVHVRPSEVKETRWGQPIPGRVPPNTSVQITFHVPAHSEAIGVSIVAYSYWPVRLRKYFPLAFREYFRAAGIYVITIDEPS